MFLAKTHGWTLCPEHAYKTNALLSALEKKASESGLNAYVNEEAYSVGDDAIFTISSESDSIITASYKKIDEDGVVTKVMITLGDDNAKTRRPINREPASKSMIFFEYLFTYFIERMVDHDKFMGGIAEDMQVFESHSAENAGSCAELDANMLIEKLFSDNNSQGIIFLLDFSFNKIGENIVVESSGGGKYWTEKIPTTATTTTQKKNNESLKIINTTTTTTTQKKNKNVISDDDIYFGETDNALSLHQNTEPTEPENSDSTPVLSFTSQNAENSDTLNSVSVSSSEKNEKAEKSSSSWNSLWSFLNS